MGPHHSTLQQGVAQAHAALNQLELSHAKCEDLTVMAAFYNTVSNTFENAFSHFARQKFRNSNNLEPLITTKTSKITIKTSK